MNCANLNIIEQYLTNKGYNIDDIDNKKKMYAFMLNCFTVNELKYFCLNHNIKIIKYTSSKRCIISHILKHEINLLTTVTQHEYKQYKKPIKKKKIEKEIEKKQEKTESDKPDKIPSFTVDFS